MRAWSWILVLLAACAGPGRYRQWTYAAPVADGAWPTARASDVGLDEAILQRMTRDLAAERLVQMRSILVVREGKLVLELYDRPSRRDHLQDLRSTTKSLTALVVVELAFRGDLDLDAPVGEYLDVPNTPEWQATTLDHLLSMRSGLACDDSDRASPGNEDAMYRRGDWIAFWTGLPHLDAPGTTARYCTGNLVAAGRIAERATGRPFPDLASEILFAPLGIETLEWERFDGGRGTDTGGHLHLRPRDLARIGQALVDIDRGAELPLSVEAVNAATAIQTDLGGRWYGLAWWLDTVHTDDGRQLRLWYTSGNGGQHLFVLPDLQLVAVFTGDAYNHPDAAAPFAVMGQAVLPAAGVKAVAAPAPDG